MIFSVSIKKSTERLTIVFLGLPRNLSDHMDRQARIRGTMLLRIRELQESEIVNLLRSPGIDSQPGGIDSLDLKHLHITGSGQILPWWLAGKGLKTTVCTKLKGAQA
jgi:hypothetical protein